MKRTRDPREILIKMPEYVDLGPPMQVHYPPMEEYYEPPRRTLSAEELEEKYIEPSQNVNRFVPLGSWLKPGSPKRTWAPRRRPTPIKRAATAPMRILDVVKRLTSQSPGSPTQIETKKARGIRVPVMVAQAPAASGSQTQLEPGKTRAVQVVAAAAPAPAPVKKRRRVPSGSQPSALTHEEYYGRPTASQGDVHYIEWAD